jgi:hypothetical protein
MAFVWPHCRIMDCLPIDAWQSIHDALHNATDRDHMRRAFAGHVAIQPTAFDAVRARLAEKLASAPVPVSTLLGTFVHLRLSPRTCMKLHKTDHVLGHLYTVTVLCLDADSAGWTSRVEGHRAHQLLHHKPVILHEQYRVCGCSPTVHVKRWMNGLPVQHGTDSGEVWYSWLPVRLPWTWTWTNTADYMGFTALATASSSSSTHVD